MMTTEKSLLDVVDELKPVIEAHRAESDVLRRQPQAIVDAMIERDLFRVQLPKDLGGWGVGPVDFLAAVERVASWDGSAAWNFAISGGAATFAGYMPPEVARGVFGAPHGNIAGSPAPTGQATRVEGGYRLTGRWAWCSAIYQATHAIVGAIVPAGDNGGAPTGLPPLRQFLVPISDVTILDTWHVGGLRGTGSTEIELNDVIVPDERVFLVFFSPPRNPSPFYRLPPSFFGVTLTGVALGIARGAIDAMVELATKKTPAFAREGLKDNPAVQHDIAEAEALLGAARAYLYESMSELWANALAGEAAPLPLRAKIRRAQVHGARSAARAVDLMCAAAGGHAIFESSPFERCHRDVHAVLAHVTQTRTMMTDAGRAQLGVPTQAPLF
jgi:alkylation response protein AidB-like acyl-CoA dehydrogenase